MFDANISALIDGVEIDTPENALSLAKSIHPAFGAFEIYFDEIEGRRNVYWVSSHDEVVSDANGLPRGVDFNNPICQDIETPPPALFPLVASSRSTVQPVRSCIYQWRASTLMRSSGRCKNRVCGQTAPPTWAIYFPRSSTMRPGVIGLALGQQLRFDLYKGCRQRAFKPKFCYC